MNPESNKSKSIPQDHDLHQNQRPFYQIDWNNVCKEQALIHHSTQALYACYSPYFQNLPFIQHPYQYPLFEQRFSAPGFSFYPMTYPYQIQVRDTSKDFQNAFAHTEAPNDEDTKKQLKNTKIQEPEMDGTYSNVKQKPQNSFIQPIRNQFNARRQPLSYPQINTKALGNAETMYQLTRKERVNRYKIKKQKRRYQKRIVYQCRKSVADNRQRSKGRFVKRVQTTAQKDKDELSSKKLQNASP